MFLSSIEINNFRCFGSKQTIEFHKGLNVLVGENDSGKSAVLDAIRIVLGTTDQSWYKIELSDFYNENQNTEIKIVCKFSDLSEDEKSAFLECLSYDTTMDKDGNEITVFNLYLHWTCKYLTSFKTPRVITNISTGVNGDGPTPSQESRELLKTTYLRPLRDAYSNMQSGRGSRLSQILNSVSDLKQGENNYVENMDLHKLSLVGIANLSNKLLSEHPQIKNTNNEIEKIMSDKMLLKGDGISTNFEVSGTNQSDDKKLLSLLEKIDLSVHKSPQHGHVGLGTSNILSMACELLLNRGEESSFLLIEEPEAHIHVQRQVRLIRALQDEAAKAVSNNQIILTTHSPVLASVVELENIIVIKDAIPYSLAKGKTKLEDDDYKFLERYLDATKANLFFAKGVIIVEGPSEELLLPTIAKLLGMDLTEYGVSIVNVRSTGLRRYARIFQRSNDEVLNIPVACITDRDIMPDCAPAICIKKEYSDKTKWPKKEDRKWTVESEYPTEQSKVDWVANIKNKSDGQKVKTFVANDWTFEYDLAKAGLIEELIDVIVKLNYIESNRETKKKEILEIISSLDTIEEKSSYVYKTFHKGTTSKAEAAQELSFILEEKYSNARDKLLEKLPQYIVDAIKYATIGE